MKPRCVGDAHAMPIRGVRSWRRLYVCLALTTAFASGEPAVASWNAVAVPGASPSPFDPLTLGFAGSSPGLIGFTEDAGDSVRVVASTLTAAAPGPPRVLATLRRGDVGPQGWLVPTAPGTMTLLASEPPPIGDATAVWLRTGPTAGPLGAQRVLSRNAGIADVAVSPRGDLAAVLRVVRPPLHHTSQWAIRIVVRRPNGRLRRVRLARAAPFDTAPTVAFNARGDLLMVYDAPRQLPRDRILHQFRARLLTATGHLRPVHRIGRVRSARDVFGTGKVMAALAGDRRAIVGWSIVPCFDTGCGRSTLGAGLARADLRFGRARVLARIPATNARFPGPVVVAASEDGPSTVAWNELRGGALALMRAPVSGGRLGRKTRVSRAGRNARAVAIATGPGSAVALAWTEAPRSKQPLLSPEALRVSFRSAGGVFGPSDTVSTRLRNPLEGVGGTPLDQSEIPTALAIDPQSGRPLVVWHGTSHSLQVGTPPG